MTWILEHLNLVIVGALVLGSFLKSRFDSVKEEEPEADPFTDFGESEVPGHSDRGSPPPMPYVPPPIEREQAPVRRKSKQPPVQTSTKSMPGAAQAAAAEAARELEYQLQLAARMDQVREAKAAANLRPSSAPQRVAPSKRVAAATVTVPRSIRASLRNPSEIRRAFVMREILDPPVGLK